MLEGKELDPILAADAVVDDAGQGGEGADDLGYLSTLDGLPDKDKQFVEDRENVLLDS